MAPIPFVDNYKNKSPIFQFRNIIKSGLFIFRKWIRTKSTLSVGIGFQIPMMKSIWKE